MIAYLRGIIGKEATGEVTIDVNGVGYRAWMPLNEWDELTDAAEALLFISTYVREDRFDLFGFTERSTRALFEELIELSGIGPRMALELCSVPRALLLRAVQEKDAALLTTVKGVGKKTAEKILLELSSLAERDPSVFASASAAGAPPSLLDRDALDALIQLGYNTQDALRALGSLPSDLNTTEERVTASLRLL